MRVRPRPVTACLAASVAAVALLFMPAARGADLDAGELERVAGLGDLAAVQQLLAAGVDVNARTHTGSTALVAAAAGRHRDVVLALLAARASPDLAPQGQWTALLHAAHAGEVEILEALIHAGADLDTAASSLGGGRTPLMAALSNGNMRIAHRLLQAGASVHATTNYGATALWFTVRSDRPEHLDMTRALLAAGAAVDAGQHPRYRLPADPIGTGSATATVPGALPIVTVAPGARTAEGTVLGLAARSGITGQMRLLLDGGAKVDARQPGWTTPLMLAAAAGRAEAVRVLLEAGADVTATDSAGRNALAHARLGGNAQVITMLEATQVTAAAPRP